MGYNCCRTYFHTITIYSIASCDLNTHIHHGGQQFQATLQVAIAHHGTMPNNPNLVPTSVNLSPQQLIDATTNIPPNTDAPAFVDPVGELFRVFELEFQVKSSEKILQFANFSR